MPIWFIKGVDPTTQGRVWWNGSDWVTDFSQAKQYISHEDVVKVSETEFKDESIRSIYIVEGFN
jgi:hypothetical protein